MKKLLVVNGAFEVLFEFIYGQPLGEGEDIEL